MAVSTTNLLRYFKLDDNAANTTVLDATGGGNATGNTNTANWYTASGKINGGADFNGSEFADTNYSTNLNIFSVSFWFKLPAANTINTFIAKDVNASRGWVIRTNNSKIDFEYNGTGNHTGSTIIQNNTWYHILAISDGTNMKLWLNGVLEASGTTTLNSNAAKISLGRRNYVGAQQYMTGILDEVAIWNNSGTYGLSEAQELYNS